MSEQHFHTPGPVRLEVKIPAGAVTIVTVDDPQATVKLDGPEYVVDSVAVELTGDRLLVEQRRKPWLNLFQRWDAPFEVEVRVPCGSSADITTASADVRLQGRFAGLAMTSASGALSSAGEVEGDARVRTASGDVRLSRITGALTVRTVSGDVQADAVAASVSVQSVSGTVQIGSVREGQVTVRSVSGDVELGIASGTSIDVDAGSASGELSSEVPLSDVPGGDAERVVVIRTHTVSGDFHVFRAA